MSSSPHASLAVGPAAARGGLLAAVSRGVIAPLLRGLRVLDPMWPQPAPPRGDLDSQLLDHLAG